MLELYKNIKNRRLQLGMSQQNLAEKTGYTDRSSIAKIEAGLVDLTQTKIHAFAKALNTTAPELMGWDEESDDFPSPSITEDYTTFPVIGEVVAGYDHIAIRNISIKTGFKNMETIYHEIAALGARFGAEKIVLFGSRARGDHRERSDIDLAVYGLAKEREAAFRLAVEELDTLLDFDVVFVSADTDAALVANIEKDGVLLMSKFEEKYSKLKTAVARLKEAVSDYENTGLDSVRDGAIQRFEFCTELAWKTTREYLTEQGYTEINSPKAVFRAAFADGILNNEQGWLSILNSRNITSHVYDEKTALTVFENIKTVYIPLFDDLISMLHGC